MGTLHIDFLGTSFNLKATEDSDYLEQLSGYYKEIINDVSKIDSVRTPLQKSILAGIMLCDQLYKSKSALLELQNKSNKSQTQLFNNDNSQENIEKINQLIEKINNAL